MHVENCVKSPARAEVSVMVMPDGHVARDTAVAPIDSMLEYVDTGLIEKYDDVAGQPASPFE